MGPYAQPFMAAPKKEKLGRPLLASNAALSWFTERATMDDRFAQWTSTSPRELQDARARYFAIGFPHGCNNSSHDMWSTFYEGHRPRQWQGSTDAAMMEGFQPLEIHTARLPELGVCSPEPVDGGVAGHVSSVGSRSARSTGRKPGNVEGASNASTRIATDASRASSGGVPAGAPSGASVSSRQRCNSSCSYVQRLDTLRRVQPRPRVAGPVRKLDWDMFTVSAQKDFDFEATGQRAIFPTVMPGAKPYAYGERRRKKGKGNGT
ncbi:unnamed protein product [Durusdinium trenchii]|uniref:Uncharacterized protein n=1 Tax=Durusdinium trenchii TaxID=1381693 RepID=A0ABP0HXZ6_9DINO